jgi:hypothetical protein
MLLVRTGSAWELGAATRNARAWFSEHLVDLSQSALTMYGAVVGAFSE